MADMDQPSLQDLLLGGVSARECATTADAEFFSYLLGEAGIRSAFLAPAGKLDLRLPQVRVAPDDVKMALAVLATPVSESIRQEYAALSYDNAEFADKRCPRCHSEDIVLLPEKPAYLNDWSCDSCGNHWQNALPERS